MKKIPSIIIRDYALLGLGFFAFFTLMRPYGMQNSVGDTLWLLQSFGCCLLVFLTSVLVEMCVTYIFSMPCDYSKEWPYQFRRKIIHYPLLIALLSAIIGIYFTIIANGWENWYYFWLDGEGNFTLKWYLNNFLQDIVWCIFIATYWYFMTNSRMKEHKIQELQALNDVIEKSGNDIEQDMEEVNMASNSKEPFLVSPTDILYIESMANYLNIWYFTNGELKQKRLRNTLKNVEMALANYPFMLHCHRAFLVNTKFITHVDGNSAGCQLHLFSIDKTIPVSKANFDALRHALQ